MGQCEIKVCSSLLLIELPKVTRLMIMMTIESDNMSSDKSSSHSSSKGNSSSSSSSSSSSDNGNNNNKYINDKGGDMIEK